METEAVLKAGHVVESESDMQSCATVTERDEASSESSRWFFIAAVPFVLDLAPALHLHLFDFVVVVFGDLDLCGSHTRVVSTRSSGCVMEPLAWWAVPLRS